MPVISALFIKAIIVGRFCETPTQSLEHWPSSTANSVLVLTPLNPQLEERILDRAKELAHRALRGMRNCRVVYDNAGAAPPRGATSPHRLAALTRLRQAMVARHLRGERWALWVDADSVDYTAQLIDEFDIHHNFFFFSAHD